MDDFIRVYAYVDGGNFREDATQHGNPRFIDFHELAARLARLRKLQDLLHGHCEVVRVYYYDAEPDPADPDQTAILSYFGALDGLPAVHVRHGYLRRASKSSRRQQKGVDVLLTVDMLEAATRGVFDAAMLFSGDGDFAPLVEAVVHAGPRVVVVSYSDRLSDDLAVVADQVLPIDELGIQIPELVP